MVLTDFVTIHRSKIVAKVPDTCAFDVRGSGAQFKIDGLGGNAKFVKEVIQYGTISNYRLDKCFAVH